MQNGFIESFNGRLQDELLNETLFTSLAQARVTTALWRAYLRSVIDRVDADGTEIRIHGARCFGAACDGEWGDQAGVSSFVRKWRTAPGDDENYVYAIALHNSP